MPGFEQMNDRSRIDSSDAPASKVVLPLYDWGQCHPQDARSATATDPPTRRGRAVWTYTRAVAGRINDDDVATVRERAKIEDVIGSWRRRQAWSPMSP